MEDSVFYKNLNNYVKNIVNDIFNITESTSITSATKKTLGLCPKCGSGKITESAKAYGCSEWKQGCDFVIWKTVAGKKISEKNVIDLLEKKETGMIKGFQGKTKSFDAKLKLTKDFKTIFQF